MQSDITVTADTIYIRRENWQKNMRTAKRIIYLRSGPRIREAVKRTLMGAVIDPGDELRVTYNVAFEDMRKRK